MQNCHFPSKIALRLKKVCYKVSLCENCQRQSCRAFIGLTIHAKIIGGGRLLLHEILGQSDRLGAKSPIFDLLSFVAPQPYYVAKKVQLTLIESSYALSNEPKMIIVRCPYVPQMGTQKAKCAKFEQYAVITPKRHEIGCQLLLITNRKSHMGFRLIPTSTLNDLERHNSPFCIFSPNSIALLANYVIVVEDRPIMSVKCCLPFTIFYFWP